MAKAKSGGGGGGKPAPKSAPKVSKDSKGNIDPRFGKKIQQEQGVLKTPRSPGRGNPLTASKRGISTNNLFAYSYTKPFYAPIGVDKKRKKRGKQGGGETVPPPGPGPALPPFEPAEISFPPAPVMVPERDVVDLATEQLDSKTIENLLFENIGANELVKFVRHDTVEGNNPSYNIISNLSDIRRKFNPDELISVQVSDSPFRSNSINLNNKIPSDEYLEALGLTDYVYIDESGNLVIEVVNMRDKEVIEVQIDSNGTIYEVN
jgi:hypothetical protein